MSTGNARGLCADILCVISLTRRSSYAFKSSKQITTVHNMVKAIQSARGPAMELLPFVPVAPAKTPQQ